MARILIAWELGANLGHVGQLLPLARALRMAGHTVFLALQRQAATLPMIAREGFGHFVAPAVWETHSDDQLTAAIGESRIVESYGDLLRLVGWVDAPALSLALRAWCSLFQLASPDLLICHAAPTAQLAARDLPMLVARLGTGFECPPLISPFVPMRYWQPVDQAAMRRREHELFESVMQAYRLVDGDRAAAIRSDFPENLADLLRPSTDFLCTLPELDHYPRRPAIVAHGQAQRANESTVMAVAGESGDGPDVGIRYHGPLLTSTQGLEPAWPKVPGPRILAYLRPPFGSALDLLRALRKGPWSTLLVIPGWPEAEARALASPFLNVATAPVRMDRALQECQAVITYGGHGTVAGSLLAGKPVLNLPKNTEQLLVSRHAAKTGAGLIASAEVQGQDMPAFITRLVDDARITAAARSLAATHSNLRQDSTCAKLVTELEGLMQ